MSYSFTDSDAFPYSRGYPSIYRGVDENGKEVVIRRIVNGASKKKFESCTREIIKLIDLRHPGIPPIIDSFAAGSDFHIVFQCQSCCSLREECEYRGKEGLAVLNQSEVLMIFFEVLEILSYIQDKGVVHRPIKADNIFWDQDDGKIQLLDLIVPHNEDSSGTSTVAATDLWTFGATLFHLVTGSAIPDFHESDLKWGFLPDAYSALSPERKKLWDDLPPAFRNTVTQCLSSDPTLRPTVTELVAREEIQELAMKCSWRKKQCPRYHHKRQESLPQSQRRHSVQIVDPAEAEATAGVAAAEASAGMGSEQDGAQTSDKEEGVNTAPQTGQSVEEAPPKSHVSTIASLLAAELSLTASDTGDNSDDRPKREQIMRNWLRTNCPYIRPENIANYAKLFYEDNASAMERVAKRILKKPSWLSEIGVHEDDEEDIVDALRASGMMEPTTPSLSSTAASKGAHGISSTSSTPAANIESRLVSAECKSNPGSANKQNKMGLDSVTTVGNGSSGRFNHDTAASTSSSSSTPGSQMMKIISAAINAKIKAENEAKRGKAVTAPRVFASADSGIIQHATEILSTKISVMWKKATVLLDFSKNKSAESPSILNNLTYESVEAFVRSNQSVLVILLLSIICSWLLLMVLQRPQGNTLESAIESAVRAASSSSAGSDFDALNDRISPDSSSSHNSHGGDSFHQQQHQQQYRYQHQPETVGAQVDFLLGSISPKRFGRYVTGLFFPQFQ